MDLQLPLSAQRLLVRIPHILMVVLFLQVTILSNVSSIAVTFISTHNTYSYTDCSSTYYCVCHSNQYDDDYLYTGDDNWDDNWDDNGDDNGDGVFDIRQLSKDGIKMLPCSGKYHKRNQCKVRTPDDAKRNKAKPIEGRGYFHLNLHECKKKLKSNNESKPLCTWYWCATKNGCIRANAGEMCSDAERAWLIFALVVVVIIPFCLFCIAFVGNDESSEEGIFLCGLGLLFIITPFFIIVSLALSECDNTYKFRIAYAQPTLFPTSLPSPPPTPLPTLSPTMYPTASHYPTIVPTPSPSSLPTYLPTPHPTIVPTPSPSSLPTLLPTPYPTSTPTPNTTKRPTTPPTDNPSSAPTVSPHPTLIPTPKPTNLPSSLPTPFPSSHPTSKPTNIPTVLPIPIPTVSHRPTLRPSQVPTPFPSQRPTAIPGFLSKGIYFTEFTMSLFGYSFLLVLMMFSIHVYYGVLMRHDLLNKSSVAFKLFFSQMDMAGDILYISFATWASPFLRLLAVIVLFLPFLFMTITLLRSKYLPKIIEGFTKMRTSIKAWFEWTLKLRCLDYCARRYNTENPTCPFEEFTDLILWTLGKMITFSIQAVIWFVHHVLFILVLFGAVIYQFFYLSSKSLILEVKPVHEETCTDPNDDDDEKNGLFNQALALELVFESFPQIILSIVNQVAIDKYEGRSSGLLFYIQVITSVLFVVNELFPLISSICNNGFDIQKGLRKKKVMKMKPAKKKDIEATIVSDSIDLSRVYKNKREAEIQMS